MALKTQVLALDMHTYVELQPFPADNWNWN